MRLDSARELKMMMTRMVAADPEAEAESVISSTRMLVRGRAFGVQAQPFANVSPLLRTMAVGLVKRRANDYHLAVRIQQRSLADSPALRELRRRAKQELDVRYIGRVVKRATPWHQKNSRPIRIGCSVSHYKVTAGTLGCFVRSRATDEIMFLSNNHVLANENNAKAGDAILQRGCLDGGRQPRDVIGRLGKFIRLKKTRPNFVDVALAHIDESVDYLARSIKGLSAIKGLGPAFLEDGTKVAKLGRTTGLTRGRVTAFELDNLVINYDLGDLRFDSAVEIEGVGDAAFSDGGDSGSLIVDADKRGVALLFGGSDHGGSNGQGLTFANPLGAVLDALAVDLV